MTTSEKLLWDIATSYTRDYPFRASVRDVVLGSIRARNLQQIAEMRYPFGFALQADEELGLRQLSCFFKKNASYSDDAVCSSTANLSFARAERICKITNKRLDFYDLHRDRLDPDMKLWLSRMESSIRLTLGPKPMFLDELPKLIRVTGGATEDRPRRRALPFLKISRKVRAPRRAHPLISSYISYLGYTDEIRFVDIDSNRVEFVPKNYKTHRTIACEPTGLLPFQLAVDAWIKRRLLKVGIDLRDQTRNQDLARIGSLTGEYATLDLSMASDTLSINCVAWLLPEDWFVFLETLRCSQYKGTVGTGSYQKWSSMGNGFTFTLETLIFWAAARAVGDLEPAVYGDDIVVKTENYPDLVRLLRFLGFHVNKEKSFFSGPFRESCGADWYEGRNVTPFYIRKTPKSRAELSHLVNGLVPLSFEGGELWTLCERLIREYKLDIVPVNSDTMSGVHVDVHTSYALRKIVIRNQIPYFRGYKAAGNTRRNCGWRTYFIWRNFQKERVSNSWIDSRESLREMTRWAVGCVTYKRKLIHYHPMTVATPLILSSWSDFIRSRLETSRRPKTRFRPKGR